MVPEASPSPPAPGEREGAESASALVEALEAMRQCKEVALQASRRLFARGLRDGPTPARDEAEQARSELLQVCDRLDSVELRMREALAEQNVQDAWASDLEQQHKQSQVDLAEMRGEISFLQAELSSTEDKLSSAQDKLYLQVMFACFRCSAPLRLRARF